MRSGLESLLRLSRKYEDGIKEGQAVASSGVHVWSQVAVWALVSFSDVSGVRVLGLHPSLILPLLRSADQPLGFLVTVK